MSGSLAIDVAFLICGGTGERARKINRFFWEKSHEGYLFDKTHLPHVTLLQQFVGASELPKAVAALEEFLDDFNGIQLKVIGIDKISTTTHFVVEPAGELLRLHEKIVEAFLPWAGCSGNADSFFGHNEEKPRPNDIEWVKNYRQRSSLTHFYPHITLGIGEPPKFEAPFFFEADNIALCHLGRFCACRAILKQRVR